LLDNVAGHQNVKDSFLVIPIQFDAAVEIARPILGEYIFGFDRHNEMVNVLLLLIVNAKIIDNQGEHEWLRCVFPEARSIFAFVIALWGKMLLQELVGKDPGLGETPDGLAHLEVDVSSNNFGIEVVLVDDPQRKEIDGHFHVLVTVESRCKVEVADVEAHVLRFWGAEDTVPIQLGGCHVGSARGEFSGIVY
jgi:hypothetical protein